MVLGGELADRGTHERTVAADQFGRHLRQEPVGVELAVVDETDALAPKRCKARRQANLLNAFRYDRLDQGTHSGSLRDLLDNIGSNNIQGCEPAQVRHTPRGGAAKRTRTPTPPERPLYRASTRYRFLTLAVYHRAFPLAQALAVCQGRTPPKTVAISRRFPKSHLH